MLRRGDQVRQVAGVRHVPFEIHRAGRPIFNRAGRLHERAGQLVGSTGSVSFPPVRGSWQVTGPDADALTREWIGPHLERSAALDQGWLALSGKTVPVWSVTVRATNGPAVWRAFLHAQTGERIALVNLVRTIDGTGSVFVPNIQSSPNPTLVPLRRLDASGYLSGEVTQVLGRDTLPPYRPDHVFDFPPSDPNFVRTNVYQTLTEVGLFAVDHGFAPFLEPVVAYTDLLDPNDDPLNNAFYDPTIPAFGFGDGDGVVTSNLGTDQDVPAHEMGHHIFEDLVDPFFLSASAPVAAMAEGVSDTFAALYSNDPNIGESTTPGEPFLRRVANGRRYLDDDSTAPHETGLIYGGANWDLSRELGPSLFADILIAGLPFLPSIARETEYRDALIEGDRVITGGANTGTIQAEFVERGFDALELPAGLDGFLTDGVSTSGVVFESAEVDQAVDIYLFAEFPGSDAVTFDMDDDPSGPFGDADLLVAPLATFDPNDPRTFAISERFFTSDERVQFTRVTTPSVDDDDAWFVAVGDFFGDGLDSGYTLVAEATIPPNQIQIDGAPLTGALDEQGEIDLITFTGTAGQFVRLEAAPLAPDLDPVVIITDFDGEEFLGAARSRRGADAVIQGAMLPATQVYLITVVSPLADIEPDIGTGGYRLTLTTCNNVGPNLDGDIFVDACDDDDDNDEFVDPLDDDPLDPTICVDFDSDGCDDCSVTGMGAAPGNDGPDADADGFCDVGDIDDDNDGCRDASDPAPFLFSADGDADFVGADCDNCTEVSNPAQLDADAGSDDDSSRAGIQHYGDACDADLNNDGLVNTADFFGEWRPCFGSSVAEVPACQAADCDGNGVVNTADFFLCFRPQFGGPPGPGATEP